MPIAWGGGMRVLSAALLVLGTAGLSMSSVSSALADEMLSGEDGDFRLYSGVTRPELRERFDRETLPFLAKYLRYWEAYGFALPLRPLPFVILPESGQGAESVRALYGDRFFDELDQLVAEAANPESGEENDRMTIRTVNQFTLRYPFFANLLAIPIAYLGKADPPNVRRALPVLRQELSSEGVSFDSIESIRGNGQFAYLPGQARLMSMLVVKSSGSMFAGGRIEVPFLNPTLLAHELGHGLQYDFFQDDAPLALQEGAADLMALHYLDTPCFEPFQGERAPSLPKCVRSLDQHARALAEDLWSYRYHDSGQAAWHFVWLRRSEMSREEFSKAFAASIRDWRPPQAKEGILDGAGEALSELEDDVRGYRFNFEVISRFARSFCTQEAEGDPKSICSKASEFLGAPNERALKQIIENSIERFPPEGRLVKVGGQEALLKFERVAQGERKRPRYQAVLSASEHVAYLDCPDRMQLRTGDGRSPGYQRQCKGPKGMLLTWDSSGRLKFHGPVAWDLGPYRDPIGNHLELDEDDEEI